MMTTVALLAVLISLSNAIPVQLYDDGEVQNKGMRLLTDGLGWHLDRIDQREKILDGNYCPIGQGRGVDIYVFSTGIEYEHEEFEGRAFYGGYDITGHEGRNCFSDSWGTVVASLAAGKTVGVAKKAKVYSVKVLKCHTLGYVEDFSPVIEAMEHVIEMVKFRQRRSVIALPHLGFRNHPDVNAVIKKAVDEAIVVVSSAGFNAKDACMVSPASSPDVITVGSTIRKDVIINNDFLFGINYGKCVTLFAPGHNIRAAAISSRCLFKLPNNCYKTRFGDTKEACGIVAGAAALVLEQFPNYTPEQVKQHLVNEATDGAINMLRLFPRIRVETPNKLLYIGSDDKCVDKEIPFSGSGDYNNDDEDLWELVN